MIGMQYRAVAQIDICATAYFLYLFYIFLKLFKVLFKVELG